MNTYEERIVALLALGSMSIPQIVEGLSIRRETIGRAMRQLEKRGKVRRQGSIKPRTGRPAYMWRLA